MAVRLGSRGSALAVAQAEIVARQLAGLGEQVELLRIGTSGDERAGAGAPVQPGDKSRFVKEIEQALLRDEVDLAVHSAKDVPAELPAGLAIVGVPARADARDALCGAADELTALPRGATIGTASLRRRSQLLAARPDLEVRELRGNVDTRLRRLAEGEFAALVLAAAGLERLGRAAEGTPMPAAAMTPAPGQGCLILEARADDQRVRLLAEPLTDHEALVALTAERALVKALEATCDTPVGAHAQLDGDALRLDGFAGTPDGATWVSDSLGGEPAEPAALGRAVGERMLAAGAAEVLHAASTRGGDGRAIPPRGG